jgi:glycosyltransferase involved in cell wall biosynthesis
MYSFTEYADAIMQIINISEEQRDIIRKNARERSQKFNEKAFATAWNTAISNIL